MAAQLSDFSKSRSPILMKFGADVRHLRPTFIVNFSEVKVKVQGQNRHTENLPLAIALLSFKISSQKLAIRQKYFI